MKKPDIYNGEQEPRKKYIPFAESLIRDVDALEEDSDFGEVNLLGGDRPDNPKYEENKIKRQLVAETFAASMRAIMAAEGTTDEVKLEQFEAYVKENLLATHPPSKGYKVGLAELHEIYMYARGGDTKNTALYLGNMYFSLESEFQSKFETKVYPTREEIAKEREETADSAKKAVKKKGMELDAETRAKLGYKSTREEDLHGKRPIMNYRSNHGK